MIDIAKSFGFGDQEQQRDAEAERIIPVRNHEVFVNFDALRIAVYSENPTVVLEEDGIIEKAGATATEKIVNMTPQSETPPAEQPAPTPQAVDVAGNVISMAAYRSEREIKEAEQNLASARALTAAALEQDDPEAPRAIPA